MNLPDFLTENLIPFLAILSGLTGTCLAVIGTLTGVVVGGVMGYETQKKLQIRQRLRAIDDQSREWKRNGLLEVSRKATQVVSAIDNLVLYIGIGADTIEVDKMSRFLEERLDFMTAMGTYVYDQELMQFIVKEFLPLTVGLTVDNISEKRKESKIVILDLQLRIQKLIEQTFEPEND